MIRDKLTKKGIPDAVVKVEDHDHDVRSGERLHSAHPTAFWEMRFVVPMSTFVERRGVVRCAPAPDGDYWRLLNPGEYKVVVWAEGYFPSMRRCQVGMEPRPTICDFTLTPTPVERLKEIQASGGKVPQDLQLRLRALRLRKLRASTKAINRRREQQQQRARRARSTGARRA